MARSSNSVCPGRYMWTSSPSVASFAIDQPSYVEASPSSSSICPQGPPPE
eukprot:CAMPEP_0198212408 /NCGR_PEP_ID=MMETSP1445-20131203/25939_1 /TAXON_ID=36898 /ORGANISM="Pyramimonas sp., Strain CCMP2087" /LENGTH=49 /DNA_ID=CAMNT_0043886841 /DNA_START=318 /DNA_END=467 /DNA_ORIENTATION=-